MARLILITGGARSGKSSHALKLAETIGHKRLFIATCPSVDREMTERVRRHKEERRGRGWTTIECETELGSLFSEQVKEFDVVLVDCVTLWVNNVLYSHDRFGKTINDLLIGQLCREWLDTTDGYSGTVVCVTNEVGLGIVPDNALARKYRDLVGTCNQIIGKKAEEVIIVSCGIPFHIKKAV
ncbi:MAG: bifunctional adenosylcobinamide kinase/adenosylcobinamide-phosphate guanylyltransferase [Proteobacteria bacterium]|nr:bifunctional adenosylcobinamide kinase/adenosylcobinamide-phosphate guanylyltransferase [Pseudomonadota bacterium]